MRVITRRYHGPKGEKCNCRTADFPLRRSQWRWRFWHIFYFGRCLSIHKYHRHRMVPGAVGSADAYFFAASMRSICWK